MLILIWIFVLLKYSFFFKGQTSIPERNCPVKQQKDMKRILRLDNRCGDKCQEKVVMKVLNALAILVIPGVAINRQDPPQCLCKGASG